MATLTITRGLPGSGKTRLALATGAALAGRDRFRVALHGGYTGLPAHEAQVTVAQLAVIYALLHRGDDVAVDDCNLRAEHLAPLVRLGRECGAEVVIVDLTDVPLEVCIERDAQRTGTDRVGEQRIREMHAAWLASLA